MDRTKWNKVDELLANQKGREALDYILSLESGLSKDNETQITLHYYKQLCYKHLSDLENAKKIQNNYCDLGCQNEIDLLRL